MMLQQGSQYALSILYTVYPQVQYLFVGTGVYPKKETLEVMFRSRQTFKRV
jgi:hypothetical protein